MAARGARSEGAAARLGRVSRLNAVGRVLHPLAGLEPEFPVPAAEHAVIVPAMTPTPGPAAAERPGVLTIDRGEGLEGEYTTSSSPPVRCGKPGEQLPDKSMQRRYQVEASGASDGPRDRRQRDLQIDAVAGSINRCRHCP
jgi:hypothetical protein